MTTYYLINVFGCVEPEIVGPFATFEERDIAALNLRKDQDEADALFWLDVENGVPTTGAYSGGFFEDGIAANDIGCASYVRD